MLGSLPPALPWPEVQAALAEHERLVVERNRANARIEELALERRQAVEEDRQALADAIRAGKREPADTRVQDVDAKVQAEQRRSEALARAVTDAERALVELVERNREEWLAAHRQTLEQRREDYRAALDEAAKRFQAVAEAEGIERWIAQFPAGKGYHAVQRKLVGVRAEPLVEQTFAALREAAEPPPLPERNYFVGPPRHVPAAQAARLQQ